MQETGAEIDAGGVTDPSVARAWPSVLATFVHVLEALFKRRGRTPDLASAEAHAAVLALSEYLGGRMIYLPKGDRIKAALRDVQIAAQLGKKAAADLAIEHQLTEGQIYRIARQQRAIGRARRSHADAS